jgi:hypothetical protein
MVERVITETRIRIVRQGGRRGYVEEAWAFPSPGEASLDRDELLAQIENELGSTEYYLDDTLRRTNWGADGSALDIILTVGEVAGSLGGVIALVEQALKRMRKRSGALTEQLTAERATTIARHAVAATMSQSPEDVKMNEVVQNGDFYRVSLSHRKSRSRYSVEIGPTGVSHISRVKRSRLGWAMSRLFRKRS